MMDNVCTVEIQNLNKALTKYLAKLKSCKSKISKGSPGEYVLCIVIYFLIQLMIFNFELWLPNLDTAPLTIMKGFVKKSYYTWNKIYRVSFSIIVKKLPNHPWANVIHFTTGSNDAVYGSRVPAVWIPNKRRSFYICSAVSGNKDYCKYFNFSLGKQYDITIQQSKQNGKYWYEIRINNHLKLKVQNTRPMIFSNVKEYISNPWFLPFNSDLGTISNFEG